MIHVVIGHICAGKSTWVRQHSRPGDVVIDLDRLALALTVEDTRHHDYPTHVREIARGVRWFAIDESVRAHRFGSVKNVWIVHAYPSDDDMARYRRAGAAVKEMTARPETLVARAKAERPPRMVAELERRLADGGWGTQQSCHSTHDPTAALR